MEGHREDVEKVAKMLLEREVITRLDMRNMLGKRPHGRGDDMDTWLDEHQHGSESSAPPPLERPTEPEPTPQPTPGVASSSLPRGPDAPL